MESRLLDEEALAMWRDQAAAWSLHTDDPGETGEHEIPGTRTPITDAHAGLTITVPLGPPARWIGLWSTDGRLLWADRALSLLHPGDTVHMLSIDEWARRMRLRFV